MFNSVKPKTEIVNYVSDGWNESEGSHIHITSSGESIERIFVDSDGVMHIIISDPYSKKKFLCSDYDLKKGHYHKKTGMKSDRELNRFVNGMRTVIINRWKK